MIELPPGMLRNQRPKDRHFDAEEFLYRREDPELWHERLVDRAAIALPDLSVGRSKYGHPEWLRLEGEEYRHWAVVGFQVQDIPERLVHQGNDVWTFDAQHVPQEENYPHSEVWGYKNGVHVNAKRDLDPELHLRWRDQLRWKTRTFLRPHQQAPIR